MRFGLAFVLVLGACTHVEGNPVRTVDIVIHHSRFQPSTLDVDAGTKVRFVIHNNDPIDHELIVGDDAVQIRHEKGTEVHHGDIPGEVSVAAGAISETTFSFRRQGRFIMACHLPGHFAYGMRGTIEVG